VIPIIKGILFDLDGTLFDRDASIRTLVKEQHARFRLDLEGVLLDNFVTRFVELDAHGYLDKASVYSSIVSEFNLRDEMQESLVADFWSKYHLHARSFPEAEKALIELRSLGFKLGIVTNGKVINQERVIDKLGIAKYFDTIIISEREGIRKPNREIYERALFNLALSPKDSIHVGDHPINDIEGAINAGLIAVWRRNEYWAPSKLAHYEVQSLNEVATIVRNIAQ
jgi:putative hydrolase of the HAD superfamily